MRTATGTKYRWLTVGARATFVGRQAKKGLYGQTGTILAVPDLKPWDGMKNVTMKLDNGGGVIAPAGCYRPLGSTTPPTEHKGEVK